MKAGRELDALVAEKVFGCRIIREKDGCKVNPHCGCDLRRPHDGDEDDTCGLIKEYSTSIADAWDVLDKLKGHVEQFHDYGDPSRSAVHIVTAFGSADGQVRAFEASGESPAHAICLVALKVVGLS